MNYFTTHANPFNVGNEPLRDIGTEALIETK